MLGSQPGALSHRNEQIKQARFRSRWVDTSEECRVLQVINHSQTHAEPPEAPISPWFNTSDLIRFIGTRFGDGLTHKSLRGTNTTPPIIPPQEKSLCIPLTLLWEQTKKLRKTKLCFPMNARTNKNEYRFSGAKSQTIRLLCVDGVNYKVR
jgi:hypothetical protein